MLDGMLDLAAANAENARILAKAGFAALSPNLQLRITALLLEHQDDAGLIEDGTYDTPTELSLNALVAKYGGSLTGAVPITPALKGVEGFTAAEVVNRALRMVAECAAPGSTNDYELGFGATYDKPSAFANATTQCDCTGFASWCEGYKRGNYNTDGLALDAWVHSGFTQTTKPGPRKLVVPVDPADMRPGDIIVFRGPDGDHDGKRDYPGHAGVLIDVEAGTVLHAKGWADRVRVAHCRWQNRAVRVTTAEPYFDKPRTMVLRCKRVRYA